MNKRLQVALLLTVFVYFLMLVLFLRKNKFNLKYTILWIFSGILMLVLALFPDLLRLFSQLVGIAIPSNALFTLVIFCLIMIVMSLTAIVSKMNEQIKRLTQYVALMEKRLRDQELHSAWEKAQENSSLHV